MSTLPSSDDVPVPVEMETTFYCLMCTVDVPLALVHELYDVQKETWPRVFPWFTLETTKICETCSLEMDKFLVRRIAAGLSNEDYVDVSDEEDEDSYVDFLLESSDTYRYRQSQSSDSSDNAVNRPSRPSCDVEPSLPICNDCTSSAIVADRRRPPAAAATPTTWQQAQIDEHVRNSSSSPRATVDPRLMDRTTWGNCRFCHRFLRSSV